MPHVFPSNVGGPSRTRHFFVFIEADIQNETMFSRRATPKVKTVCCGDVIAQKTAFSDPPEAVAMHGSLEVDLTTQEGIHTRYSVAAREYKSDGNSLLQSVNNRLLRLTDSTAF